MKKNFQNGSSENETKTLLWSGTGAGKIVPLSVSTHRASTGEGGEGREFMPNSRSHSRFPRSQLRSQQLFYLFMMNFLSFWMLPPVQTLHM